jgi:hypothetical protein
MSLDLQPLAALGQWSSQDDHVDPDGELLEPRPADEQPVGWDDDDLYRDES